MPSPHPPLRGPWLDIVTALANFGPQPRTTLRLGLGLSNKQFKIYSKLMKMRNLIDIKDGLVWITNEGETRLAQTQEAARDAQATA